MLGLTVRMRAVVYDPEARANLRLADVDEPVAAESETLIEVRATALNFGEVHWIDRMRKPGEVPGWDAAGVVLQAAADGSGPPVGIRLVGFHGASGGYSGAPCRRKTLQYFRIRSIRPGSGATGGRGDRTAGAARAGPVVGRRMLITGASGGVGRFGVQLAARAGAHVIAAVGSAARGEGLAGWAPPRLWSDCTA